MKRHTINVTSKNSEAGDMAYATVTWDSDKITAGDVLKVTLIEIFNEWFLTEEGYDCYMESNEQFNLGDLGNLAECGMQVGHDFRELLRKADIHNLSVDTFSAPCEDWDFDEKLFDINQREKFEEAYGQRIDAASYTNEA